MGLYSWECPECGYSITTDPVEGFEWQNVVVVQLPIDAGELTHPFAASYDGYGGLCEDPVPEPDARLPYLQDINLAEYNEVRLYHRACWLAAGCPTPLKISPNAKDQGFFLGNHPRPDPFENPLDSLKALVDTPLEELPLLIPRVEHMTAPLKRLYEGLLNGTICPLYVRHLWDRASSWNPPCP